MWGATDNSPVAQKILMKHTTKINHVWRDVLDRLPPTVRREAIRITKQRLDLGQCAQKEHSLGHISAAEFDLEWTRQGRLLQEQLKELLGDIEFEETAYCLVHDRKCHLSPRSDLEYRSAYWMEGAGHMCCPWSSMPCGGGAKWLDWATLTFLVWAYSVRFFEPDSVLEENVPRFKHDALSDILNDFDDGTPKHVHARHLETGTRQYVVQEATFSPTQLGVPAERWRKYVSYHLSPFIICNFSVPLSALFFRKLVLDGTIYFKHSTEEMRRTEIADFISRKKGPPLAALGDAEDHAGLSAGSITRLEQFVEVAKEAGWLNDDGDWVEVEGAPSMALANVTQNESYSKMKTDVIPALLPGSILYDLRRKELMLACEAWVAQGFAHPMLMIPGRKFLFEDCLLDLSDPEALNVVQQRKMIGNSFHSAAIGCWLAYNMAATDRSAIS